MSSLCGGSEPDAATLDLTRQQIEELFPFHAVFDDQMQLTHAGPSLRKLLPHLKLGMNLSEYWQLERPLIGFSYEEIHAQEKSLFLIRAADQIRLRGQMISMPGRRTAFLCSPWLPEAGGLAASGLTFDDFPLHDSMPEFAQVVQSQRLGMQDLRKLSDKLRQQREALKEANRKQIEQSAESRKLALIAARTDNGVVVTDASGAIEWVNEGFTRMTGFGVEEVRGQKPGDLLQGPETDPDTVCFMQKRIRRGEAFDCEILNYNKKGEKYWVSIEVQPIHDNHGQIVNFMAIQRDITTRKREETLKQLAYEVSSILAESSDASNVLNRIVQAIVEAVGCLFSVIWRLDQDSLTASKLWSIPLMRDSHFEKATRELTLRRGEGLPGAVLEANAPMWIPDLALEPAFVRKHAAALDNLRSGFAFPIRVGGEPRGVIEFFSARTEAKDDELMATLAGLGTQIGQFMERQDNEAERARLLSLLHSTLESTADGILVVDRDLQFVTWNERFLDIWSLSATTMRQNLRSDVSRDAAKQVKDPEDFSRRIHWWYNHPDESGEDIIHFRNGRVFERTTQPQRVADSVIGRVWSYRDITDRWRAAEKLRESEESYRVITTTASDGILTIDAHNRILFSNQAAERMFGYQSGTLNGRNLRDLMPADFRRLGSRELLRIVHSATSGAAPKPAEIRGLRADGTEFPLDVSFGISHLRGERILTGVLRDVTERRETEEKLATAILTMQRATVMAETANRAKSDFLASVSHEIRTPLNSIAGLTELLRETQLDQAQRDMVETVWAGSESLLHLINDLLDFSKIEAGQVDIVESEFDLEATAERAIEIVKSKAQAKGLHLVFATSPEAKPLVKGDANRIGQILANLLSNGIKFTETGSVLLEMDLTPASEGAVGIRFSVIDTGIGIRQEDRDRVFEKFYRADTQVGRRAGGTGLGLSISRLLAAAMGGSLELEGDVDSGSTFTLSLKLPIAKPSVVADSAITGIAWLVASPERFTLLERAWRSTGLTIVPASSNPPDRVCDIVLRESGQSWGEAAPPVPQLIIRQPGAPAEDANTTIEYPLTPARMRSATRRALGGDNAIAADGAKSRVRQLASESARVLLVEDYVDSANYAKLVLEGGGHAVTWAATVAEALRAAEQQPFDLIFMDLSLPDGSGLDAARLIRQTYLAGEVPIIALTAHALRDFRDMAHAAHMQAYLTKPISPSDLLAAVATWVKPACRDIVVVRADIADLVPGFLERSREKLLSVNQLTADGNYEAVARIGHNLKGAGSTYGFDEITRLGDHLESAALAEDAPRAEAAANRLATYLDALRWETR